VSGVFYLAWRYLAWHRTKTSVLVAAITLVIFLPSALQLLVNRTADDMTARAVDTPLLLGARGSPVELTLSSLYFSAEDPDLLDYREADALSSSGLADSIPLYVHYRARGYAIVGTSLDYFHFRNLEIADGRPLVQLGEAVLGAGVADALGLGVGDAIVSAPETLFDLAGVYPLKMPVVGVLAPSYTSDDSAVFVDLKTAWVINGLGHGHQDLAQPAAQSAVVSADDERIVANASLVQYNEITDANRDSFHFHGDLSGYPLTAVLPVTADDKSKTLVQGRYLDHPELQMIEPSNVMDDLLATVFSVQRYVLLAIGMVAVATAAVVVLVFVLSLRLRSGEMLTMTRLGGARLAISGLMAAEMIIVLVLAVALATLLNLLVFTWGDILMNQLLLT
jgi:putative ABC transport system permease protein